MDSQSDHVSDIRNATIDEVTKFIREMAEAMRHPEMDNDMKKKTHTMDSLADIIEMTLKTKAPALTIGGAGNGEEGK